MVVASSITPCVTLSLSLPSPPLLSLGAISDRPLPFSRVPYPAGSEGQKRHSARRAGEGATHTHIAPLRDFRLPPSPLPLPLLRSSPFSRKPSSQSPQKIAATAAPILPGGAPPEPSPPPAAGSRGGGAPANARPPLRLFPVIVPGLPP